MDRPRTLAELAAMVEVMRRDQEHDRNYSTPASRMKRAYSEQVVDSAVLWIRADEPSPPPQPETDEEAAAVAVYFASNPL
jgi:mono/diheme cytochrome c family protein